MGAHHMHEISAVLMPQNGQAVAKQRFRDAMASLPASVNIVTTDGPAGKAGVTASAVCSLTDEPPMLIVCLNQELRAAKTALANGRVAVNLLSQDDQDLSAVFAGQRGLEMAERFETGAPWTVLSTGAPVLATAVGTFDCEIDHVHQVGTHHVLYCRVIDLQQNGSRQNLIYHERQYKVCPAPR
jgi:flavin reductase